MPKEQSPQATYARRRDAAPHNKLRSLRRETPRTQPTEEETAHVHVVRAGVAGADIPSKNGAIKAALLLELSASGALLAEAAGCFS